MALSGASRRKQIPSSKVHPEWLGPGAPADPDGKFWQQRYEDINNFEKHLTRNGTLILKFFLHISKDEQKRRFLERLTNPEKHWKFSEADLAEREHWKAYQKVFEDALTATSTKRAPWHVIGRIHAGIHLWHRRRTL